MGATGAHHLGSFRRAGRSGSSASGYAGSADGRRGYGDDQSLSPPTTPPVPSDQYAGPGGGLRCVVSRRTPCGSTESRWSTCLRSLEVRISQDCGRDHRSRFALGRALSMSECRHPSAPRKDTCNDHFSGEQLSRLLSPGTPATGVSGAQSGCRRGRRRRRRRQ